MLDELAQPAYKELRTGTHRSRTFEETLARVRPLMPAMGITRVANVTGLDHIGIPTVMVCRPNSRSLAVSQGKGVTVLAAKTSGIMESIEGYHAEHITLPVKYASCEELRYTHTVVDVADLPGIAGSLYHPLLRLLWIEGYDVMAHKPVWVPYELVHMDFTLPLPPGSGCFPLSSNGLASGNHLLEAVSHALSEAIERDSTSLWMLKDDSDRRRTKVRLETIDDGVCCEVLDRFQRADVGVVVWDTTSDIGVPSFLCTITQRSPDPWRPVLSATGMGCHPSRNIALVRALTEAAQSRLTYIAGSRDDAFRRKYARSQDPRLLDFFLSELDVPSQRDFAEVPHLEAGTLNEDVDWQVARLQAVGVRRVVVVDLTRPEFRIPVVRVVVSGIEGTDEAAGYVPGRRAQALLRSRP